MHSTNTDIYFGSFRVLFAFHSGKIENVEISVQNEMEVSMGLFDKLLGTKTKVDEDPLVKALRSLGSTDEKIRQNASKELLNTGPAIIPYLVAIIENKQAENEWSEAEKILESLDCNVRRGVIDLIEDLNSTNEVRMKAANKKFRSLPSDSKILIQSLSDIRNARDIARIQCKSAEKLLMSFGNVTAPYLIKALTTTDRIIKDKVLSMLETVELNDSGAVPVLISILADKSSDTRLKAVRILGKMKGLAKKAINPLLNLHDYSHEVQTALVNIGSSNISALVQRLADKDDGVKIIVAEVLGCIGPNANMALTDLYVLLKSDNQKVRTSAAKAILHIGRDPNGIPIIIESLADGNGDVQMYIREILVLYGEPAIPHLVKKLQSGSPVEKTNVARVLGLMKSAASEALQDLERALDDEDINVRHEVIIAIGSIGCISASIPLKLIDMWKQSGENVILETLCKIKEPKAIDILLRAAFSSPHDGTPDNIKKCLMLFSDTSILNDKIISWAVDASTYQHKYRGYKYDEGYILLDLSNNAILSLCNIRTPITSNILHMVAEKKDISITMSTGCSAGWTNTVSFQNQRDMAFKELAARGNPIYDPSLFVNNLKSRLVDTNQQIEIEARNEKERRYKKLLDGAKNPNSALGEDKWKFYDVLVKEFKTKEVFQLLIHDLSKYKTIPLGDLNKFEWLLIQSALGLQDQEVVNMLYPIREAWPNLYASVNNRSVAMKKANSNG